MNNKQFDYGVEPYKVQSILFFNSLSAVAFSIHHTSHHHEHPAH